MKASLRFEVLKRDRFTCAYCGGIPPTVLLEVDHIVPRSGGGTDDLDNLITACERCNRGKAAKRLEDGLASGLSEKSIESLRERLEQAKQFQALQAEIEKFRGKQLEQIWSLWCHRFGGERDKEGWYRCEYGFPQESRLRETLERLPLSTVLDAIHWTADKFTYGPQGRQTFAYFWAVLRNKEARAEDSDGS